MRTTIFILLLLIAGAAAWWLFREAPPRVDRVPTVGPAAPVQDPAASSAEPTEASRVLAEPAGEQRIDVRVADVSTGERVIGCSIELWQRMPGARPPAPPEVKRATAVSRAGGAVVFAELAYGSYVLRVHDDAYTGDDVAIELTNESPLGQAAILTRKRE